MSKYQGIKPSSFALAFSKVVLYLIVSNRAGVADCVSADEDLQLNKQENDVLQKFKQEMVTLLPHEHMKQDIYLIRWLRAKDLKVDAAKDMLLENLRWRKENKMDTITKEDWSDMRDNYEYHADGFDKQGRPLGTAAVGSWNIRNAVLAGKLNRFIRYEYKILEELSQKVLQQQHQGRKVTRWKMIMNMEDFNVIQNACSVCLRTYLALATAIANYYPDLADAIIFINTPPMFNIVLDATRSLLPPETAKALKVFGYDKKMWMKYLDKDINPDQRRPMFGGSMKE